MVKFYHQELQMLVKKNKESYQLSIKRARNLALL